MNLPARRPNIMWLFFSPSGRAGRQVFILGWLFWTMVNSFTLAKLATDYEDDDVLSIWGGIFFITVALSLLSAVMLSIKRLHDIGFPSLPVVFIFVPVISLVMLFALCLWPSAPGPNVYGPATDWPKT